MIIPSVAKFTTGMKHRTMYRLPRPTLRWFISQSGHSKNAPQFHWPMYCAPGTALA